MHACLKNVLHRGSLAGRFFFLQMTTGNKFRFEGRISSALRRWATRTTMVHGTSSVTRTYVHDETLCAGRHYVKRGRRVRSISALDYSWSVCVCVFVWTRHLGINWPQKTRGKEINGRGKPTRLKPAPRCRVPIAHWKKSCKLTG